MENPFTCRSHAYPFLFHFVLITLCDLHHYLFSWSAQKLCFYYFGWLNTNPGEICASVSISLRTCTPLPVSNLKMSHHAEMYCHYPPMKKHSSVLGDGIKALSGHCCVLVGFVIWFEELTLLKPNNCMSDSFKPALLIKRCFHKERRYKTVLILLIRMRFSLRNILFCDIFYVDTSIRYYITYQGL